MKITTKLLGGLLISNLLLTGCATMATKMAYQIAAEEEAKGCEASYKNNSPVDLPTCERISKLIKQIGITGGYVGYDAYGRLQLRGDYENEEQVDRAFVLAQTIVGARSLAVSPITPRNIGEIQMEKVYQPPSQAALSRSGNKYALLVGVSTFKNLPDNGIETADDDVLALAKLLEANGYETKRLIDSAATKQNIIAEMDKIKAIASEEDTVLFYISTHGLQPNKLGQLEIVPYDLAGSVTTLSKDPTDEQIINEARSRYHVMQTAISQQELQDFMRGNQAGKFVAIVDTCYSGAAMGAIMKPLGGDKYVQRESQYAYSLSNQQIGDMIGKETGAGSKDLFVDQPMASANITMSPQYLTDQPPEQFDYKNLPTPQKEPKKIVVQHGARVFLTATSKDEQSLFMPNSRMKNSIFTYYLINGLGQTDGQIAKAFDYAKIRTENLVKEHQNYRIFHGKHQIPNMESTSDENANIGLFY